MRKFIAETKAKGATPIVLSLTVRNIWKDGKVERGSGNFGQWSAEIAKAEGVPFIDVTNAIADRYEKMGEDKVKALFPQDHTHTSPEGADLNASLVVAGLKGLRQPAGGVPLGEGPGRGAVPALLGWRRRLCACRCPPTRHCRPCS